MYSQNYKQINCTEAKFSKEYVPMKQKLYCACLTELQMKETCKSINYIIIIFPHIKAL